MDKLTCRLAAQGFKPGSCSVSHGDEKEAACRVTLKREGDIPYRLIKSVHLSRPEHYLSIYQSGCNLSCKKCHSWELTQQASGRWMSPDAIGALARDYVHKYEELMYWEPRERATSFHAHDIRLDRLRPEQIVLSPQGWGPARNIVAFTGGDLGCQPEFYARATEGIKNLGENLWVLFETNGYGLSPENLDMLKSAGLDAFWLDVKAYDPETHRRLTGASNEWILKLPAEMVARGFVLEVSSLYIPGWVETGQLESIASLLATVDPEIPFTILAFFPEYMMKDVPSPSLDSMIKAYQAVKGAGLKRVRLGNTGVFVRTVEEYECLKRYVV